MFNLKDFIEDQSEGEVSTEVDLSPLLALMVTLIPVLLLQTSFISMKMLETTLPVLSDTKEEKKDDKKKEDKFELNIFAKGDNSVVVETVVNERKVDSTTIKAQDKDFNYEAFTKQIVEVKKKHPEKISAKLTPEDSVSYKKIVKILDSIRKVPPADAIKYKDKKGQMVETTMLFPDVVFGNVAD